MRRSNWSAGVAGLARGANTHALKHAGRRLGKCALLVADDGRLCWKQQIGWRVAVG
jgi:hypothetical protein